ncbi:hypothetical protein Ana3638_08195 [Anaerocolumna sedimenticola]|uniref:BIG2 domain-containing protein n=1 Tax=Anaerocolumna sedimenticola TaxID=2696063 RepID=A0A6P1THY3_9FIRM|nr:hypothetical protein [Anaerocolumna sedimenticola]QHQ60754.1 hypothetical protein Ana3638_08195 [Anaerocolumna sedimenticola]
MINLRKLIAALFFVLALTLSVALPSPLTANAYAEDILSLYVGQSLDLDINKFSTDKNISSGRWHSGDTTMVTTDMYGHVTAVGAGTTDLIFDYKKGGKTIPVYNIQITVTHGPLTVTTVPEAVGGSIKDAASHIVFIMNYNMVNSKVAEFYKYLGDFTGHSTVDCIYSYSISTILTDQTVISKITDADKVIMVGLQPTIDNLDILESYTKAGVKFDLAFYQTSNESVFKYSALKSDLESVGLNIMSARQVWIDMYYADIADEKQLNFTDSDSTPTPIAGLGLAISLQYNFNNNSCNDISYSDLLNKMTAGVLDGIDEDIFNKTKNLITVGRMFPLNENDPVLHLSEVNEPNMLNQYTQKHYEVFKTFYNGNTAHGIFTMEQTPAGAPVCYNSIRLDPDYMKDEKLYAWTGGKWKPLKSVPAEEYSLRVLTWSDGTWITESFRYTDSGTKPNPLKKQDTNEIKRDSNGNWYISVRYEDKFYIYQLDKSLKVKHEVCISDLTDSQNTGFYLLSDGKVLLKTYDPADSSSHAPNNLQLYNNLQLLDLASGKIIREYDTGYYPSSGDIKVNGKFIYMQDYSEDNIIVIDSDSGKVINIIHLADYGYLIKLHDYSELLGSQYNYDYAVSGKYMYILKKTGIYRINMENGHLRTLMDGSHEPFNIQDMRFLDFKVKNSNTFYILAVFFDAECAADFYTYTK